MDFQVVVLAGGSSKDLIPLVSKELPKALLPVADRPVLSYVLELLEDSNLKDIIVIVEEEDADAASRIGAWISSSFADRLNVKVATVPDDVGTAGALRTVINHLYANDILVVSGDLVTDVPPGAVAATHRRHDAVVTALFCAAPVSGPSETGFSAGKDKAKKSGRYNIVGLDSTRQFLLHVASGSEVEKDIRIQKNVLRSVGQMEVRVDLMDAHLYAFKRIVLKEVLEQKSTFESIQRDVLPYLVRSQLRSEVSLKGIPVEEENWNRKAISESIQTWLSLHCRGAPSGFHEPYFMNVDRSVDVPRRHKCCAYIANKSKYCMRLNSIQSFSDINRDVIGEASHISGYSFSAQNNIIHPSAKQGAKTTIGQQCMIAEGSQLGDKCNVKRSVIGRHCRIGSNVKIVNSVVMNHVSIEDGCTVQGSIICSNVQLQEGCVLRDCQSMFSLSCPLKESPRPVGGGDGSVLVRRRRREGAPGAMASDRRVGVAVDFSLCSREALRWAVDNVVRDGDHIILVNVQKEAHYEEGEMQLWEATGSPFIPLSELCDPVIAKKYGVKPDADSLDILNCVAKQKEVVIVLKIYWGDAREKICEAIDDIPLSCLVIGNRGLGKIKRVLLGSVSNYVVNHGNCPVTVVKHSELEA